MVTNIKNFRAPEKKACKQASSLCSLLFLLKHLYFTMQFFLHVTTHKKLVFGLKISCWIQKCQEFKDLPSTVQAALNRENGGKI